MGAVPFCHVGAPQQVFPARGPYLGGNLVTITGTDFTPSSSVLFDGVAASVTFVSDTTLVVQPPPHEVPPPTVNPPSGQQQLGGFGQVTIDVTVTNLCGTQTLEDAYTYVAFRR